MTLVINTVSDSTKAQKDLADLRKSVSGIETSVQKVTESFSKMAVGIAAAGAALATTKAFLEMSDSMTNLENKIKAVSTSTDQYKKALQGVKDLALSTRTDMNATAALYQRIAINQKEIGINTKDTLRVVEIVNKSMKVAGASTAEATSALLQFGQALGSGKLQGDELRSLAENAPTLFKAIADGVGIPIGKMKQFGEQGKLTTSVIIPAVLKAGKNVDEVFGGLTVTYGDAFKNLGSAFTQLKDSASKYFFGSKNALATWLNDIALSAGKIAKHFGYYMTIARANVALFVFNAILLFEELIPDVTAIAQKIGSIAVGLFEKWSPELKKAGDYLRNWLGTLGGSFSGVFDAMAANLKGNTFFAPIIDAFYSVREFLKVSFRSIWNTLGVNTIDVGTFFKNFEPVKKMVLSFVHTLERAFFWLYDRVIGHSWIPDLVEGVEKWTAKLLEKPLDFVKSFTNKVSDFFKYITSPLKSSGVSSFVDSLKSGVGEIKRLISKLGGMFSGNNSSFFDRVSDKLKDLIKPKSTLDKLKDKFKDAVAPKSGFEKMKDKVSAVFAPKSGLEKASDSLKDIFSIKAPFQSMKDGIGNAIDGVLSTMGIAIEGIVKMIPEKLQVPLALAASAAFSMAMAGLSSNPAIKTGLFALGSAIAAATSLKFLSPDAVSEAAFGFANTVLTVLSKGLEKLIGGNAFFNPVGLISLLAKFALLFAAGRKFLGEVAGKILQAPTKLGQNIGARVDLKVAESEEKKLKANLSNLPANISKAVKETNDVFIARQKDLKTLLNQQIVARRAGERGPDTTAATNAVLQARKNAEAARSDQANIGGLQRDLNNSIAAQKDRSDAIKKALKESGERARENFRTNTSAVGGLVGGVGGLQLGTDFLKVIPNAPEWVKVATVISTGFIGQVIGSSIGSVFASAINFAFQNAGSLISTVLRVTPWWLQAVVGIAGALYVGYQLFQSLPDSWTASIKKFFGVGGEDGKGDVGTLGIASITLQIAGYLAAALTVVKGFPAVTQWLKNIFTIGSSGAGGLFMSRFEMWIGRFIGAISGIIPTVVKDFGSVLIRVFRGLAGPIVSAVGKIPGPTWFKLVAALLLAAVGSRSIAGETNVPKPPDDKATIDSVRTSLSYAPSTAMMMDPSIIDEIVPYSKGGFKEKTPMSSVSASENASEMNRLRSKQTLPARRGAEVDERRTDYVKPGLADKWLGELSGFLKEGSTGQKIVENLKDYFKDLDKKVEPLNPGETPKAGVAGVAGAGTAVTSKVFSDALNGMSNEKIGETMANYLNKNGFKNVAGQDIGDAATRNPASIGMLSKLVDRLAEMDDITRRFGGKDTIKGAASNFEAGKIRKEIDDFMIQNLDFKEKNSKLVNQSDGEDPTARKGKMDHFAEVFANIGKQFPNLQLSFEDFINMETGKALELTQLAKAAADEVNLLNAKVIGTKSNGIITADDLKEQKDIAARNKERAKTAEGIVRPTRSSIANLMPIFNEVQVGLSEDILNALRDGTLKGLETSAKKIKDIKDSLAKTPDLPGNEEFRIGLAEKLKAVTQQLQDQIRSATLEASASFDKASLLGSANGLDISRGMYNRLSQIERDALQRTLVLLETKQKAANANDVAPEVAKNLQDEIDAIKSNLNIEMSRKGVIAGEDSGKAFASSLKESFTSAFGGALRGQADENRSVLLTMYDKMLDSLTNGILDTFTKSFADGLIGEGSPLFGGLKELGKGVSNWATGLIGKEPTITDASKGLASGDAAFNAAIGKSSLKTTLDSSWETLKSTLSTSWTDMSGVLKSSWGDLGNLLNSGLDGIMKSFGSSSGSPSSGKGGWGDIFSTVMSFFADGGKVAGPGSSRSDSIPAMLSNGEFVVNARQAGRYMPLLHAINSGQMPHFADGGLVSPVNIATIQAPRGAGGASSVSTFNITVTGDISNQTRSEIQKMIPQIASGVNTHNYEKGRRR
jgi:tape measure domain-containing protein